MLHSCFILSTTSLRPFKQKNDLESYNYVANDLYILVEKRNCALLKNQLKINIKIKFINCVQYIVE
jgi:hypothetical protein